MLKILLSCVVLAASVTCRFDYEDLYSDVDDLNIENLANDAVLSNLPENLKSSNDEEGVGYLKFSKELNDNEIDEGIINYVNNQHRVYIDRFFPTIFGTKKQKHSVCLIPKPCVISLPSASRRRCAEQRQKEIFLARMWYEITDGRKLSTIEFPIKQIPWLNQTMEKGKYYYALDEFESRYLSLAGLWSKLVKTIGAKLQAKFGYYNFYSYSDYKAVYDAFGADVKTLQTPQYFASYTDDPTFTDYITNNKWQHDDVFVQILQTGNCPWLIRKVTLLGDVGIKANDLLKQLNPDFNFDYAISKVYGKTITVKEAINDERLFVLYHEEYNDIESQPDIMDKDPNDSRTMMNVTSPITIMILNADGELKLAAIQWDYKPDSKVYTPESSSYEWLLAKGMVSLSHQDVCQLKYHLGHMHFVGQVYCLFFRRHFSTLHPLYDVFKYHCEGTIPHITQAYASLLQPNSYGHKLFSISNIGVEKLSAQAYEEREYGMFNYARILQAKGLDDKRIKYNPVAEDGKLIWKEIEHYASHIVNLYYKRDRHVLTDKELQSYASEVSADGTIGSGKYTGFPARFTSKRQLKDFLTTFMWHPVIHATVNYNLAPVYVPIRPSKLYNDTAPTAAGSYPHTLPDASVTVGITEFANQLAYFRANRILDYYNKVRDGKLKRIAWNAYNRLHGCVNKELEKRNLERKNAGKLSIPYLMPKWLTSSMHI